MDRKPVVLLKPFSLKAALCGALFLLAMISSLQAQNAPVGKSKLPTASKTKLPTAKPPAAKPATARPAIQPTERPSVEERRPEEAAFSPDGKRLVYVENISRSDDFLSSRGEICVVNIEGGEARRLTSGHDDRHPRFSPDGKQIVFTRGDDIWMVNTDGSDVRNISNSPVNEESKPEFSNDGQSLFYVRAAPDPDDEDEEDPPKYETIVQRQLNDGSEKILLQSEYQVVQVVPHPGNDNVALVLCSPIDAAGKPVDFLKLIDQERVLEKVIVEVPLNGGLPRIFYDSKSQYYLREMRLAAQRAVLVAYTKKAPSDQLLILENNALKPVPDIVFLGDISRDGKTVVGSDLIGKTGKWGFVLFDVVTQKTAPLKISNTVMLSGPLSAEQLFERANKHFAAARYDEAIADYSAVLDKEPRQAKVLFNRGLARQHKKDVKGALLDYEAALKIDPKYASPRVQRANLWRAEGRTGEALDEYSEAIKLDPQNAAAFFNRGLLYVERLEADNAIEDFNVAIGLKPDSAIYYVARGEALFNVGDNQKALDDFSKAIAINPKLATAYQWRAALHTAMGNKELASSDEAKAAELAN